MNQTTFSRLAWHMNKNFIWGTAREYIYIIYFNFFTTILVVPYFKSWQHCNNMLYEWQMSYSQKIGDLFILFFIKFRWNLSSPKLEGSHEAIWGDFPFFMEQATYAHRSPKSVRSSYAQPSPCPKGKNPAQNGHHMWKIIAPKFGSYIWATH